MESWISHPRSSSPRERGQRVYKVLGSGLHLWEEKNTGLCSAPSSLGRAGATSTGWPGPRDASGRICHLLAVGSASRSAPKTALFSTCSSQLLLIPKPARSHPYPGDRLGLMPKPLQASGTGRAGAGGDVPVAVR